MRQCLGVRVSWCRRRRQQRPWRRRQRPWSLLHGGRGCRWPLPAAPALVVVVISFIISQPSYIVYRFATIIVIFVAIILLLAVSFLFTALSSRCCYFHFCFAAISASRPLSVRACGRVGVSAGMAQCVRIPTPHGRLWAANFSAVSGPRASLPPGTDLLINLTKQDTPGFILRSQGSRDNCFCALISIVCLEAFTSHGDIRS